jgi:undecaprenyl-diphosphatase
MSLLLITALILGAVEGLTEFLPVSSTGHLIIVGDMLNFTDERAKTFEIFIQLGAILSVVWHYRVKLWSVATTLRDRSAQRFVLNLAIGFLPAAIVGLLLHRYIKAYLFNPTTVALALIIGGILILLIEHKSRPTRVGTLEQLGPIDALKVGLAQTAALFPGISRAGATIMGGMVSGLSRPVATEFSFFLAIPTMFAATIFDLYTNRRFFAVDDVFMLLVGFVIAFITALIVIRAFLHYVSRHNFVPFAYYRIVFGLLVLAYFWL